MNLKNIHESKTVRTIILTIGAIVIILVLLFIGMNIGMHRARFVGNFGQNYERNFMGPRGGGMMGWFFDEKFPSGHGVAGEIISLNLPELIVTGSDNLEKTILVNASTTVRRFQTNVAPGELKAGDFITVIGNPNDKGQVEAKLVRIMPSPIQEFNRAR